MAEGGAERGWMHISSHPLTQGALFVSAIYSGWLNYFPCVHANSNKLGKRKHMSLQ